MAMPLLRCGNKDYGIGKKQELDCKQRKLFTIIFQETYIKLLCNAK